MLTRRWIATFVTVVAILSLLAACGPTTPPPCPECPPSPEAGECPPCPEAAECPECPEVPAAEKWCSDMSLYFFVGGAEGDAFGSIVLKGAQAAEADLGPEVKYIFSGWDSETMTNQLREAVAARPDGIAMMGHPGNDAIMASAKEASEAGILMIYQNVPVPEVQAKFGGGYIGANQFNQGYALGEEAVRTLGLKAGDHAAVMIDITQETRSERERGTITALEDAGLVVTPLEARPEMTTDPNLLTPVLTAAVLADPDIKMIVYSGGQSLGAAEMYMKALDKEPGEMYNIGFDTSPAVIDGFKKGYIQLTADQQPFLQGYLPILSLCLSHKYGFASMSVETGAGFVDVNNYEVVATQAEQGYR